MENHPYYYGIAYPNDPRVGINKTTGVQEIKVQAALHIVRNFTITNKDPEVLGKIVLHAPRSYVTAGIWSPNGDKLLHSLKVYLPPFTLEGIPQNEESPLVRPFNYTDPHVMGPYAPPNLAAASTTTLVLDPTEYSEPTEGEGTNAVYFPVSILSNLPKMIVSGDLTVQETFMWYLNTWIELA